MWTIALFVFLFVVALALAALALFMYGAFKVMRDPVLSKLGTATGTAEEMAGLLGLDARTRFVPQVPGSTDAGAGDGTIFWSGTLHRWHPDTRLIKGDGFYRMFEDNEWKWEAHGRFAGEDLNCGHFFGLSLEAATKEALHYNGSLEGQTHLEIDIEGLKLLDLTDPIAAREQFRLHVKNHEVVSGSLYLMMAELIERGNGGNAITDYIGYRARSDGYDGILFFSTRALERARLTGASRVLEATTWEALFNELRSDLSWINLVVFSGARLTQATRCVRIDGTPTVENALFQREESEIDPLFEPYDAYFQDERSGFTLFPPSYAP